MEMNATRKQLKPPPGLKAQRGSKRDRRKGPRRQTNAVVFATVKNLAAAAEKDAKSRQALKAYLLDIARNNVRASVALLKFALKTEEAERRL
jgi:hypothetical protein